MYLRLRLALIGAYLSIAPLYWLPGVDFGLLALLKESIVWVLFGVCLPTLRFTNAVSWRLYLWLLLCAAFSFAAIQMNSPIPDAAQRSLDFVEPIILMVGVQSVARTDMRATLAIVKFGAFVVMVASVFALAAGLGLIEDTFVPADVVAVLGDRFAYLVGSLKLSEAGFNTGATGWGVAVGLATFTIFYFIVVGSSIWAKGLAILGLLVGFSAIVSVGARGAALAMVLTIGLWALSSKTSRLLFFGVFVLALYAVGVLGLWPQVPQEFFATTSSTDFLAQLDDIATGRISTFQAAIEDFLTSPLIGVGLEEARVDLRSGIENVAVHNVWLRAAAEGGALMLAPLLMVTVQILRLAFGRTTVRPSSNAGPDFRLVIRFGLLLALVEPGVVFGSFNNSAMFWAAIGLTMVCRRNDSSVWDRDGKYAVTHVSA